LGEDFFGVGIAAEAGADFGEHAQGGDVRGVLGEMSAQDVFGFGQAIAVHGVGRAQQSGILGGGFHVAPPGGLGGGLLIGLGEKRGHLAPDAGQSGVEG
jgi:hypothetical protein